MTEGLSPVIEQLEKERSRLTDELQEAKAAATRLEQELGKIDAALTALGAKPKKGTKKRGGGLTREDVSREVKAVLGDSPSLAGDELKATVQARLKASGKPLTGFGIQFPKALEKAKAAGAE